MPKAKEGFVRCRNGNQSPKGLSGARDLGRRKAGKGRGNAGFIAHPGYLTAMTPTVALVGQTVLKGVFDQLYVIGNLQFGEHPATVGADRLDAQ